MLKRKTNNKKHLVYIKIAHNFAVSNKKMTQQTILIK